MVLGKLPELGRPTNFDDSRARAYCAYSSCGGDCLDIFTLVYHFSFLSLSLRETARYRLKYCLIGPLSPKQPTNQWMIFGTSDKNEIFDNYFTRKCEQTLTNSKGFMVSKESTLGFMTYLRDRYQLMEGVSQGCLLSPSFSYIIECIHFHRLRVY